MLQKIMFNLCLFVALFCTTGVAQTAQKTNDTLLPSPPKVDKRVELLSIVFRLAGRSEYNQAGYENYVSDIHKHFDKYKDHPLIAYAKKLIDSNGIAYDAVMAMAVYIEQPPSLKPIIEFSDSLPESRWGAKNANKFVALLQKFYVDAKCEDFFKQEENTYKSAEEKLKIACEKLDYKWYKKDYDKIPHDQFHSIIALGNGEAGYGFNMAGKDKRKQFYAILGSLLVYHHKPKSLEDIGISEYPPKDSVDKVFLDTDDISLTKISDEDINADFSNIQDLEWVQKIAKEKKVMFIGETHYATYIQNFCNRVLFAINEADYYPLLIIEEQYSLTPFVNYFLAQKDDSEAIAYFKNNLSSFIIYKEDSLLFQDIRRWNKTHPEKLIQVGFSDMEWNREKTINGILKPYFKKISTDPTRFDSLFNLGLSTGFLSGIKPLMDKAVEANLVGDFPFITVGYIQNVITNLQATLDSKTNYMTARQKGIIHNLTDDKVFGKFFKNSKVLFHGGGYHMTTHFKDSSGYNFLREGSYFTYDYPETKGKTYSIMLEWYALELGSMSGINIDKSFMGSQYKDIITRMEKAYNAGFLKPGKPYFLFGDTRNEFTDLIIHKAYQYGNSALLLNSVNWSNMFKKSENKPDIRKVINEQKDNIGLYDSYIFIPYSPIEVIRTNQ